VTILKRRNLKEARLAMTLKQAEIAASIGVSQSTYSKYERGEASPREATWRKLSAILDKPVDHLWQQAD
jgi:transcriptional regulator with XRE-family HTH domain